MKRPSIKLTPAIDQSKGRMEQMAHKIPPIWILEKVESARLCPAWPSRGRKALGSGQWAVGTDDDSFSDCDHPLPAAGGSRREEFGQIMHGRGCDDAV